MLNPKASICISSNTGVNFESESTRLRLSLSVSNWRTSSFLSKTLTCMGQTFISSFSIDSSVSSAYHSLRKSICVLTNGSPEKISPRRSVSIFLFSASSTSRFSASPYLSRKRHSILYLQPLVRSTLKPDAPERTADSTKSCAGWYSEAFAGSHAANL
ncbi:MAG: hypothetical protein ACD_47C00584G0001 [uncultured bacterium]|nr:MAG: hypothetical protein ACD_47C00584G0001 [uncultured bacterium]